MLSNFSFVKDEAPAGRDWMDLGEAESSVPGEGEGECRNYGGQDGE